MTMHAHQPVAAVAPSRRNERDYSPIELLIRAYRRAQLRPDDLMTHPGTTIEYAIMRHHGAPPRATGKPHGGGLPELACMIQGEKDGIVERNTKLSRVGGAIRWLPKEWLPAIKAKYETSDGEIRSESYALTKCDLSKHKYRDYISKAEMWIAGQVGLRVTW